ncbi:MAG TPA: NUDIX domain-containing protein [Symbiobacteriaceae bacterium]|nr:NUDIX domain-containing protein [Symbiobacteriaceae bacterium]
MRLRKAWFTLVQVAYDLFLKINPRKLAAHVVIQDEQGRVLVLRSRYANQWSLPGGGLDRRENVDSAAIRECREELGVDVALEALTGMYYHANISAYVAIFRARIIQGEIRLSHEHSECRWALPAELPANLRQMAEDAVRYECQAILRTFG